MRKSLALAVLVAGAMHGQLASALGVGEIATASTLNQPFRAFIPLRDADGLEATQLRVELADQQAFRNAGIDRTQFLNSLEFLVEVGDDGRGRIVVSTPQPVVEPYLDFIVELRWPNGRMLREYTVLLDLPEFSQAPAAAPVVTAAPSAQVQESPAPAQTPPSTSSPVFTPTAVSSDNAGARRPRPAAEQTALPASADDGAYRVQHHDTMWRIASELRPSPDVTTEQTMIAVLRKNPDAFIGNNVNRIKSGYVLQAPSEDEVKALGKQEALEEVRRQAREWRTGRSSSAPAGEQGAVQQAPQGPQLDATPGAEATPQAGNAAGDVRFSIGSAGDSADGGEADSLERRLQQEQEALEKAQLENAAMASRVREMEKQIDTLQKLISLKNRELAALQSGADGEIAAADSPADESADTTASLAGAEQIDAESLADDTVSTPAAVELASEQDSPAASTEAEPAASSQTETAAAASANTPSTSWYETPLYRYLAAGVALFLLLVLALRRRATGEEPREPSFDNLATADDHPGLVMADAEQPGDAEPASDAMAAEAASQFDFDALDTAPDELDDDENLAAATEADSEPVQAQTSDVISEAEIYVAYGRYDQAASLLKTAIEKEPDNTELQCKLLDIYLDTRDRDNFLEAYRQLEQSGDTVALAQVKESMSAIEGVSDWLDTDAAPASLSETLDGLDEELAFLDDDEPQKTNADELLEDDALQASAEDDIAVAGDDAQTEVDAAGDWQLDDAAKDGDELSPETAEPSETAESSETAEELADFELDLDGDFDLDSLDSLEESAELSSSFAGDTDAAEPAGEEAGADIDFTLDDAFLTSADAAEQGVSDDADRPSEVAPEADGANDDQPAADADDFDLGDFDFNMEELSEPEAPESGIKDAEPSGLDSGETLNEDSAAADDFTLPDSDDNATPAADDADTESTAPEEMAAELGEPDALDLDSALAELDAEVEGLSFAEDDGADAEEQLVETLVDTADAEVDADASVALGDSELDLNDLVFDEFSADSMGDDSDVDLSDSDDVANKLDLARAFVDMGDGDSARDLLTEVLESGDDSQKAEAQSLLDQLH